jgi:alkylation response protein AidB-like acyl-CoA dehydrogenase
VVPVASHTRENTFYDPRPMDFEDTPEEAAFRAEVRTFLEGHAEPKTGTDADWSRGGMSADPQETTVYLERCRSWQRTLYDNGWAGITWPKEFGGRGGTPGESIIFNQEASLFDVTTGFIGAAQQLVGPPILRFGTDEQKKRYIPPMLRGEEMWCQLFSEPGAGSDLSAVATRAVRDGDEYVVNGQKVWTSEAQHADYGILLTRTDPEAPKHKGITFFVLDMTTAGVDIRPLVQATGLSHFNEVFFSDVRIPAENVIGEVNAGWAAARATLASEAGMIGGSGQTSTFVAVLALARECGRTEDPIVRQALADVYARGRILKFHGMRMQTAVLHKKGIPPDPSVLKNFFAQSLSQRVELALTVEGAGGMLAGADAIQEGFWQKQCMAQFASRIGGGTSEVHRNMIGERALGLPPEPRSDKDVPWKDLPKS